MMEHKPGKPLPIDSHRPVAGFMDHPVEGEDQGGQHCHSVILEQNPTDLQTDEPYLYRSIRAILGSFYR